MSMDTPSPSTRGVTLLLAASATCAAVSVVMGFVTRGPLAEGVFLGLALLCAGVAFVLWANRVLDSGPYEEERESLAASAEEVAVVEDELARGVPRSRRVWLRRSALAAGGALALGFLEPLRTLGPTPGFAPLRTSWSGRPRVVTPDGVPVRDTDVALDAFLTVFPEGHTDEADAQVILLRVKPTLLALPPERADWAPGGLVAYSKVCTHAGCPVGLYLSEVHQLLCPCHQSSFDVLRAAEPVGGPAAWPLPQLPLQVDRNGELRSAGPLSAPVGPGWWKQ
jgi:ubiquinol-cytochrome c reductase iron-sulfur subunit